MPVSFHWEYFIALLCALVSLVFFFLHRDKTLAPKILSLYFLCISYLLFIHTLVRYGDFINFPHLWRTPVLVGALNPPLAFIYVRSVLEQRYTFRRSDLLLLLIPFLLAFTFIDFYTQSVEVKRLAVEASLANRAYYLQENEGWLPPGFSLFFRSAFGIGLAIGQFVLLFRWHQINKPKLPDSRQNRSIFRWLVFFASAIASTFVLTTIQYFFQLFHEEDFYWITSATVMLTALAALTYLFLRPQILYGLHGWETTHPIPEAISQGEKPTKTTISRVSSSKPLQEDLNEKVENYLQSQKPYLRPGYTIAHLSSDTNIPLQQLSSFINQQRGQSFNEFINAYRILYIKDVLLKDATADQFTLEALGKKAGFNSRSTFIAAVKKQTGQTPSSFFSKR